MKSRSILFHCHVAPKGVYQKAYLVGRSKGQFLGYKGGTVETLEKDLEALGMDMAVALAPFEIPDGVPTERWLRSRVDPGVDANEWLYKELEKHEKILGFVTISKNLRNVEGAIKTVKEYVDKDKFVGVKIASYNEYSYGIRYNDPSLSSLYDCIEHLRVPILFHTGTGPYCAPSFVGEVASNHPELPVIMAHAGGGAYRQAARIAKEHPNCYLDLTFVFRENEGRPIPIGELILMIDLLGSERFIYGSDWPWAYEYPYSPVESIRNDLKVIGNLPISEEDRINILGKSLERLFQLK